MISSHSLRNDVPIVELSSIVEFLDHKRKPITESERVTGPYPYYGANGIQDYVADWIFDEELILLAEDGGHFENPDRGVAYKISGKSWVNNHAHVLRPTNVDVDYLKHILRNMDLMQYVNGATRLKLTKANASRIKIPLPPLAEQKRIAELLDTADRIIGLREQAIAKLDELAQSVFENLLRSNDKIEKKCLSELTIKVDSINPSEMYGEDEFTYIDIGSVNNELKVIVNPSFVKGLEAPSRARQLVKINDVLISTVRPNLNAVAMVMKEFKRPIGSTGFCVLRCDERKILPDIVFAIAKSKPFIKSMMNSATGASYPAVTDKIVKAYMVPVLKMEEQIKYVEFMRRVNKMKDQFNDYANASVLLHNSLQHQSFAVN